MSLFNSKTTTTQHRVLAELVCQDASAGAAGLVLLPTHTYKKGTVHKQTSEAQSQIAAHGLNLDRQICLHFEQGQHLLNGIHRPLMLVGNLVLSSDERKHAKMLKNIIKDPVICLGEQPRPKDMVWMDDPNMDALPPSIDADAYVSTVEKHFQIGHQACGKILSTFLADIASSDSRFLSCWMTCPHMLVTWSKQLSMGPFRAP